MLSEALESFPKWTETDVLTLLVSSGLKALKESHYRFQWPMRFTTQNCADGTRYPLNEPKASARK